jgi:hypothetical protein
MAAGSVRLKRFIRFAEYASNTGKSDGWLALFDVGTVEVINDLSIGCM